MDTLRLVLFFGIAGWSLISFVIYQTRRSDSKHAIRDLPNQSKPTRMLSADEREAIRTAFMAAPKDEHVYEIHGAMRRHGLTTNGSTTWHNLIGEIEVTLYKGWELLAAEQNTAEIVLTGKIPLVISLNGLTLIDALKEARHRDRVQAQLRSGERGTLPEREDVSLAATDTPEVAVAIVSSRKETPAEAAARAARSASGSGSAIVGWTGLLAALLACLLPSSAAWWVLLPALLLTAWSAWRFWRTPKPPLPGEIRSLHGPLHFNALVSRDSSTGATTLHGISPQMGDIALSYPPHWLPLVVAEGDGIREVDIGLEGQVLRHGRLSVYDEARQFPRPPWGRQLTMTIGAAVLTFTALLIASPLDASVSRALRRLHGSQTIQASSAATLLARDPQPGDRLQLHGRGRCLSPVDMIEDVEVAAAAALSRPDSLFDCTRLDWNAQPAALPAFGLPAEVTALQATADHIRPKKDPAQTLYSNGLYTDNGDGAQDAQVAATLRLLRKLSDIRSFPDFAARTRDVGMLCAQRHDDACDRLEQALALLGDHKDDWAGLLQAAGAHKLDEAITLSGDDAATLAGLIDDALLPAYQQTAAAMVRYVREPAAGEAVIELTGDEASTATADDGGTAEAQSPGDPLTRLKSRTQQAMATDFVADGVLLSRTLDQHGVPHLRILAQATPPTALITFGPLLVGLLSLGLLIGYGLALVRSTRQRSARKLAIVRYAEQCMR